MDKCQNCGRTIWIWPDGNWTHRKTDSQLCETGPGGDYTKLATPSQPLGTTMRAVQDDLRARCVECGQPADHGSTGPDGEKFCWACYPYPPAQPIPLATTDVLVAPPNAKIVTESESRLMDGNR